MSVATKCRLLELFQGFVLVVLEARRAEYNGVTGSTAKWVRIAYRCVLQQDFEEGY